MKKAAFLFFRVEVRNAACAVQYLVVVQTMLVRCPKNLDFTMFQKVSLSNLIFLSPRPAIIRKIVPIHFDLENRTPMASRNAPDFKSYFNLIWRELNHDA